MNEMNDMKDVLEILGELHSEIDVKSHTALVDDKTLDSFDIVTIIAFLSDRTGVSIPPEEIVAENFNSAQALCDLIGRLRGKGGA